MRVVPHLSDSSWARWLRGMAGGAAARWMVVLLLGVIFLVTAGCLGGSKNFVGAGEARAAAPVSTGASATGPKVGAPAPDFALKDLEGRTVRLSELRGKPVLLNFWATWCPPCEMEMPDLEKAYRKYQGEGVAFLGIDYGESGDTVRKYVREHGYSWSFLLDPDMQAVRSYRVFGVPTTYFVDREGILRDVYLGPLDADALEAKLAEIR